MKREKCINNELESRDRFSLRRVDMLKEAAAA